MRLEDVAPRRALDRVNLLLVGAVLAALLAVLRGVWNLDDHFITRREFLDAMTQNREQVELRVSDLQRQLDRIERNTRRER